MSPRQELYAQLRRLVPEKFGASDELQAYNENEVPSRLPAGLCNEISKRATTNRNPAWLGTARTLREIKTKYYWPCLPPMIRCNPLRPEFSEIPATKHAADESYRTSATHRRKIEDIYTGENGSY